MKILYLLSCCTALAVSSAFPVSLPYKGLTKSYEVRLYNINDTIMANVQFGSSKESVYCVVDTGSSDLWVTQACAKGSYANTTHCPSYGFDPTSSSSFRNNHTYFGTAYSDQSGVVGYFGTDTVQLSPGLTVNDLSFGVANKSMSDYAGILGLGMVALETTNHYSKPFTYENLPAKLKSSGLIETNLFSLCVGQQSLLFGAIDPTKFSGNLQTLPLESETEFIVKVEGFGMKNTTSPDFPQMALLDLGDQTLELPSSIFSWLIEGYGVEYNDDFGGYTTTCGSQFDDLNVSFGQNTIRIPSDDLLVDTGMVDDMGESICILAVMEGGPDLIVLGQPFMRSAYVVFDVYAKAIHLAQADKAMESAITTSTSTFIQPSAVSPTNTHPVEHSSVASGTTLSIDFPKATYPPTPQTVTVPGETVTFSAETITQPAETITSTQVVVLTVTSTYTVYGHC